MPGAYWLAPFSSAATAAAITDGGPSASGKPPAEVDRPGAYGERGHLGEDRRRDAVEPACEPR
ncbi:hypothetical protein [Nocardioides sp. B-3]|uniref:hypothetical protein n=1 Tax=Nocardioides sp. B-3 TaxID=2895565 RepID=UPI00215233DE|nr:hypothetical protein [Nocardioides sp. B-3]UUZ61505.1 hypothetical protein LP418_13645 [Nocardioides sp. B-3]